MTGNAVVEAKIANSDVDVPKEGVSNRKRSNVRDDFAVDPAVFVIATPGSVEAESIGALRTNLLAQHVHDGRRALSICATAGASGSTFVSVNLACAFALAGLNTLLIDADLRSPSVQNLIIPAKPISGLWQFLNDRASALHDHIQTSILPNLSVLYSGGIAENPQELLASERFNDAVSDCMREFDIVVVDTPPSNVCADGLRIAAATRYALIVARKNHTLMSDLQTLTQSLKADHAEIVGSFLNDF